MKSETIYKIGLTAVCLVTVFVAVTIVLAVPFAFVIEEELGETVSLWNVSFPLVGLIVTPVAGIVCYVRKKPLGWVLCCGYNIFLFVLLFLYYCGLRQTGGVSMEEASGLTPSLVVMSAVLATMIVLLLTDKMRAVFFPPAQDKLSDALVIAVVTAIAIGVIVFIPKLVGLIKSHYIALFILAVLFALRWVVNHK